MRILMRCCACDTVNEASSDELDAYVKRIVKLYVTPSAN